jgi:hypothetical protein
MYVCRSFAAISEDLLLQAFEIMRRQGREHPTDFIIDPEWQWFVGPRSHVEKGRLARIHRPRKLSEIVHGPTTSLGACLSALVFVEVVSSTFQVVLARTARWGVTSPNVFPCPRTYNGWQRGQGNTFGLVSGRRPAGRSRWSRPEYFVCHGVLQWT